MYRIDLSPPDFIHVPQAPRIERRPILTRGPGNEWHMWGVCGVTGRGDRVGLSNHTWSHLDAPFHLLQDGPSFQQLDPRRYLALRARVVDLTGTGPERRARVGGVEYHTAIDVEDLPDDLGAVDAVLFVTGFAELYASRYPMEPGADAHYPHVTAAAASALAALPGLKVVGIDGPSVDKPETQAAAHRTLLGRSPSPVLLLETLTFERMRRRLQPLPSRVLLTVEPLRAFGSVNQDGALSSVFAYAPAAGEEQAFAGFVDAMCGAELV